MGEQKEERDRILFLDMMKNIFHNFQYGTHTFLITRVDNKENAEFELNKIHSEPVFKHGIRRD
jgi:hypothetical protein